MPSKSAALRSRRRALQSDFERAHLQLLNGLISRGSLAEEVLSGQSSAEQLQRDAKALLFHILYVLTAASRGVLFPAAEQAAFQEEMEGLIAQKKPQECSFWDALKALKDSPSQLGRALHQSPNCQVFFAQSLSNETMMAVLQALPYPRTDDPWGDPDLAILSALYEQSLTSSPLFDPDKKCFQGSQDSQNRRRAGSFYTPEKLVRFILDRQLKELIESKPDSESLLQIRITDPACGCGRFLIPAAQQLAQALCQLEHQQSQPCIPCKTRVVRECIHGADLDHAALELCRFHLLIWTESPSLTLEELEQRIQWGDALKAPRSPTQSQDEHSSSLCWDEVIRRRCPQRGFDLVLGNPPYVSYYSKHSQAQEQDSDQPQYPWLLDICGERALPGRINLFLYFISLATYLTAEKGQFVFVLPDTILTNEQYALPRKALLKHGRLDEVWLFRHSVFSDAAVGTTVLAWSKQPSENAPARLFDVDDMEDDPKKRIREYSISPGDLLARPKAHFYPSPKLPKLPDAVPLGDKAYVKDGMNPGPRAVRRRLIRQRRDNEHCYRLIEGSNIRPLSLHWSGLWVDCSPTILSREDKRRGASLRQEWIFVSDKIVYRQTASKPIAAVDFHGHRCLNSVHNIVLKDPSQKVLIALCCYLNSTLCAEIYRGCSGESRKLFPQVHVSLMKTLPVPAFLFDETSPWTEKLVAIWQALEEDTTGSEELRENGLRQIDQVMQSYLKSQCLD